MVIQLIPKHDQLKLFCSLSIVWTCLLEHTLCIQLFLLFIKIKIIFVYPSLCLPSVWAFPEQENELEFHFQYASDCDKIEPSPK